MYGVTDKSIGRKQDQMVWTVQQVAIFAWFALVTGTKSLVVRARAGTGKTTTIVEGIKRYVAECLNSGKTVSVLATSFAKKITTVLETRLASLKGVDVKSLHSLGFYYVRQKVRGVKLDATSRKFDLARKVEPFASNCVIQLIAKLHTLAREQLPLATCGADLKELAERFDCVPTDECEDDDWTLEGLCDAAYDCMVLASKEYRVIDFADQIFLPLRNRWTFPLYDLIVVDETQDMTEAQLMLAQAACRKTGRMCCVGDDQQAIYGFRGARVDGIDLMKERTSADELGLTVTYRCPKSVVTMAQEFVPDFTAADGNSEGTITNLTVDIAMMLASACPGDFILSRTNAPLVGLCLSLLRAGKRAYVLGRDIGATLAAIIRKLKLDDVSELPAKLGEWADAQSTKARNDKRAQDEKWLTDQLDSISDKRGALSVMAEGCLTVNEILGRIQSMFADDGDASRIMLSTVHKAKGLEAANVYLCEGTFKYRCDEDERVRYVAITRTMSALHLVKGFEKDAAEQIAA